MYFKLYVGNLPFSISESALEKIFSQAGEVASVKLVTDSFDGKSRGFGFVEMVDEAAGQNAIALFDGKEIEGRKLRVTKANIQGQTSRKGLGGPRPAGGYRQW